MEGLQPREQIMFRRWVWPWYGKQLLVIARR